MTNQPNIEDKSKDNNMHNEDISKKPIVELTSPELYVANEIRSFCEMYEPFESGFDNALKELVLLASNVLDPTVPTVYPISHTSTFNIDRIKRKEKRNQIIAVVVFILAVSIMLWGTL